MLLDKLMRELRDGAVRDLAWVIGSPGLLEPGHGAFAGHVLGDPFCHERLEEAECWLRELDPNPGDLHAFLEAEHSHRLGRRFERLIEFWLRRSGVKHLRTRLQVGAAGQAIGEFDFVFKHEAWGGWQHWEAAVKFYLLQDAPSHWDAFIGPNPQDRLSDKLHKLFEKQLRLSDTPQGRAALGFPDGPAARAFVKGYLFFPPHAARPQVPGLSDLGLRGWWQRQGAAPLPAHGPEPRWKLLHRLAWLAPARAAAASESAVFDTAQINAIIARHFGRSNAPLLLAELAAQADGTWSEVARGFVVSDQWPTI
jgi:hypothetical protein